MKHPCTVADRVWKCPHFEVSIVIQSVKSLFHEKKFYGDSGSIVPVMPCNVQRKRRCGAKNLQQPGHKEFHTRPYGHTSQRRLFLSLRNGGHEQHAHLPLAQPR